MSFLNNDEQCPQSPLALGGLAGICKFCSVTEESLCWFSFGPVFVFSTWDPCKGQKEPVTYFRLDLKPEVELFKGFCTGENSRAKVCGAVLSPREVGSGSLCLFRVSWLMFPVGAQPWGFVTVELHCQSGLFWALKEGILAMQPHSLHNKFPRDAMSCGEEQAWGLFKPNLWGWTAPGVEEIWK